MLVNHKIGVIVAIMFGAFLLQNTILIIAQAFYRVFQQKHTNKPKLLR